MKEILNVDLNLNNDFKDRLILENEKNVEEIVSNSSVSINKYYLVIKGSNKLDNIERYLDNLKVLGLDIISIKSKENIEHVIMKGVNIL